MERNIDFLEKRNKVVEFFYRRGDSMKYFLIILIILAFVIGIFDLKFMLECKKEQNNKAGAFILCRG